MVTVGSIVRTAVLAVAVLAPATNAQDWKTDVLETAFYVVCQPGEVFNASLVGAAMSDRLPSLDGYTEAGKARWIRNVRTDAKLAWALLENHYGL